MQKSLMVVCCSVLFLSCDRNEILVMDDSTQTGFVIQKKQITVHPTFAVFHFEYRYISKYGAWNYYLVETSTQGYSEQKINNTSIDTAHSISGSICCLLQYQVGDSVWVRFQISGDYFDSTTTGFTKSGGFAYKDSLLCKVVE